MPAAAVIEALVERWGVAAHSVAIRSKDIHAAANSDTLACIGGTYGTTSILCVGRPRWTAKPGEQVPGAAELAARFSEAGALILGEIDGPFALAMFDSARSRGFVATDRMGLSPVFFKELPQSFAFASSPADVVAITGSRPRLSQQALFDYLYGHVIPAPRSIYEGVSRLLPGECIEIDGQSVSRRRYWRPTFVEDADVEFSALREGFLETLRASVEHAMHGARTGAFLSGGTDSSTVAGLMAQIAPEPPKTFSIGFAVSGYDEMEYARLAAAHFRTSHHEYYVTPKDIVEALPALATAHPQPFGNSSALPAYLCARLAREHGIERLLAGDGGDELYGGNARYAKQHVFSHYERVPAALRSAVIEPVCAQLARRGRLPLLGKLVSYVEQASVPMPERLETYNLLQRLGYDDVLDEGLLASVDLAEPARLNSEAYFNPTAKSLINRMLSLDMKTTLADSDLPKVVQSCDFAAIGVAFPLLDARVVEFSLALPPAMKLKGTQLRYFFKRALRGFLPDAIIRKRKHGFGLPFGEWALTDAGLRALTFDTLNSFKRRHIVKADFIDRLTSNLLPQHPGYYGTMAWIFIALELWLEHAMQEHTAVAAHAESA